MRYHKGLGVGHIYTSLRPDDDILLSDDATTTPITHRLDVGDQSPPIAHPHPDELCDASPPLINIPINMVVDAGPSVSTSNSDSDGSESDSEEDDGLLMSEYEPCSDDDELDDVDEDGDLDYED